MQIVDLAIGNHCRMPCWESASDPGSGDMQQVAKALVQDMTARTWKPVDYDCTQAMLRDGLSQHGGPVHHAAAGGHAGSRVR